jgi:hypothetical protein
MHGLPGCIKYTRLEVPCCLCIALLQVQKVIDTLSGHPGLFAKFAITDTPNYVADIDARLQNDAVDRVSLA